jgi:hypothetical protein
MENYLSTRPTSFPSLSAGIEWHARSRTIRNQTSARVSVPALLVENDSSAIATATTSQRQWTWRTDLSATKPFWENWFVGLSKKFLEARGGKLLLLAGTDRLDKELMIGQMQGRFPFARIMQQDLVVSTLTSLAFTECNPNREIPARRLPRSRPFRARRPAGQGGSGRRGLLQKE